MGAVVGGWGTLIVLFAVVSTVGITVTPARRRGRAAAHDRRHAAAGTRGWSAPRRSSSSRRGRGRAGAALAYAGGAGAARPAPRRRPGRRLGRRTPRARVPVATALAVVAGRLLGSGIAAPARDPRPGHRRARRRHGRAASGCAGGGSPPRVLLIGYGVGMGVVTVTVTAHDSEDPYAAMQTSGSCSILVALGLAVAGAVAAALAVALARPALGAGVAGQLAAYNARRRAHLLGGVLAPVIVLTAAAAGVLMLVGTDGRTIAGSARRPGHRRPSTCSTTSSSG